MDIRLAHWPTPIRLLCVIDQPGTIESVRLALGHNRFDIRLALTKTEMVRLLQVWRPHLAVVDLEACDGKLLECLNCSVPRADRIPVIALTRRRDVATRLAAFDHGVDDVLCTPFHHAELAARVLAVLRRAYRATVPTVSPLCLGDLELDTRRRRFMLAGRELRLTSLDQALLYLLVANAGHVVSRDEILDELWGAEYIADSNVVDRHIRNLRRALQDDWRHPHYIVTVPRQGYRFTLPSERA